MTALGIAGWVLFFVACVVGELRRVDEGRAFRQGRWRGQADALSAPATEALIRSVAIATVELVAEEYRITGMMARRKEISDKILEVTKGAARGVSFLGTTPTGGHGEHGNSVD